MITKEKMIDGKSVTLTTLGFFQQMELKRKIVMPAMQALLPFLDDGMDSEFEISKIESLLGGLNESELNKLISLVLSRCTIDGHDMSKKDNADEVLSSQTVLFYKIIWFFLEVNYSDFLEVIRGFLEKTGITMEKMQEKLKPSTMTMKKSL